MHIRIKQLRQQLQILIQKSVRKFRYVLPAKILKTAYEIQWQLTRKCRTHKIPEKLPGSIWGITTFFNPCGYKTNLANYHLFRDGIRRQGMPLITVELAFGDSPFALTPNDADILVQRRGGDVMWQKERLLNIALEYLPANCDKVVWLDSDILFEKENWVEETAKQLEQYMVIQPFSHLVRLPKGKTRCDWKKCRKGTKEGELFHSFGLGIAKYGIGVTSSYSLHGVPGGAWGLRKSLLQKHGFYDADIAGSGDMAIAHAFCGSTNCDYFKNLSPLNMAHYCSWAQEVYKDAKLSLNYIEGVVSHLWHGSIKDRSYEERHSITLKTDFNPNIDIEIDSNGVWKWASDKPELHKACARYFASRKEDG